MDNPSASNAMHRFAGLRLKDAEGGAHKQFRDLGFAVPIGVEYTDLAEGQMKRFPYIKFSTWVKYLLDVGRLPAQLTGSANLEAMEGKLGIFWDRFKAFCPSHAVFELARQKKVLLSRMIPLFCHADEGRSYKKQGLWILSTHGALGRGTKGYIKRKKHQIPLKRRPFGCNFVGHSWATQFMFTNMLRKLSKKHPTAIDELAALYASDMESLLYHGVVSNDRSLKVWCCLLGLKGDLPALARLGNMKRTFYNAPKAKASKKACRGVCWQCLGGQEDDPATGAVAVPYEDVSARPQWAQTLGTSDAWDITPPIVNGVGLPASLHWTFFCPDIWHCFHLGVCKYWVAGALVCLLEYLPLPLHGSMESRIEWLNEEYQHFFRTRKITPYVDEVSRETLGWPASRNCPQGAWSKGAASTQFMLFLEAFCNKHVVLAGIRDPLLKAIDARTTARKRLFWYLVL